MGSSIVIKKASDINTIPAGSTVIVGFHKDNSTAYKPYKISAESKKFLPILLKIKMSFLMFSEVLML
jgi:hypothetical protein